MASPRLIAPLAFVEGHRKTFINSDAGVELYLRVTGREHASGQEAVASADPGPQFRTALQTVRRVLDTLADDMLDEISNVAGQHYSGLRMAACAQRTILDAKLKTRIDDLHTTCAFLRHFNQQLEVEMRSSLSRDLATSMQQHLIEKNTFLDAPPRTPTPRRALSETALSPRGAPRVGLSKASDDDFTAEPVEPGQDYGVIPSFPTVAKEDVAYIAENALEQHVGLSQEHKSQESDDDSAESVSLLVRSGVAIPDLEVTSPSFRKNRMTVKLVNRNNLPIHYALKATEPLQLSVTHATGLLAPSETCVCQLRIQAEHPAVLLDQKIRVLTDTAGKKASYTWPVSFRGAPAAMAAARPPTESMVIFKNSLHPPGPPAP